MSRPCDFLKLKNINKHFYRTSCIIRIFDFYVTFVSRMNKKALQCSRLGTLVPKPPVAHDMGAGDGGRVLGSSQKLMSVLV